MLTTIFTNARVDLNSRVHAPSIFLFLSAMSGIYLVICISWLLSKWKGICTIFTILGRSAIYILLFHSWVGYEIYRLSPIQINNSIAGFSMAFIVFFLSILGSLSFKYVIESSAVLTFFFSPPRNKTN